MLGLTAPLLTGRAELAFRDGASYYQPQDHFLRREWLAGRFPLWNPWENGGVDMSADPSYGLFYPPKLLLLLPAQWPIPYHVYLVSHLVLALVTLVSGLRQTGRSRWACSVAAAAYAAGGHVLSQVHNPVYLISAAWLPLAWFGLQTWLEQRATRGLVAGSAALAMMVLGGDPQTAVHFLLIAAVLTALRSWQASSRFSNQGGSSRMPDWTHGAARLSVLVLLATGLSAVQLLPGSLASRSSYRSLYERPRSIWSRLTSTRDDVRPDTHSVRCAAPVWASHDRQIYKFSVAPWRWVELVWPNVGGRFVPRYSRWFDAIPGEGQCWSLSLYMGLLPILAASFSVRLFGGTVRRRRATWVVAISAAAALGHYGIIWLVDEVRTAIGTPAPTSWSPHVGGLYWLLVQTVPGYNLFRYPAKWWSFTALGVALLAATGVDAAIRHPVMLRSRCHGILVASLGIASLVGIFWSHIEPWWKTAATDPFFAPLSVSAARDDLLSALGHAAIVAIVLSWMLTWKRHRPAALLLLTLLELGWANQWLIITAPIRPAVEHGATGRLAQRYRGRVFRAPSRLFLPQDVRQLPAGERLTRILAWDRATLYGKHFLDLVPPVSSRSTYWPAGTEHFGGVVGPESAVMPADLWLALRIDRRSALDRLAVHTAIVPRSAVPPASASQDTNGRRGKPHRHTPSKSTVTRIDSRPWHVCHLVPLNNVTPDPAPVSRRTDVQAAWIRHQLQAPVGTRVDCSTREWRAVAARLSRLTRRWLKAVKRPRPSGSSQLQLPHADCRVSWSTERSDRIEIVFDHAVDRASLVVLPHRFSSCWNAVGRSRVRGEPVPLPVVRTSGLCLGVVVPAGTRNVTVRYGPSAVSIGAVVSGASWSLWGALLLAQLCRMRRSKR